MCPLPRGKGLEETCSKFGDNVQGRLQEPCLLQKEDTDFFFFFYIKGGFGKLILGIPYLAKGQNTKKLIASHKVEANFFFCNTLWIYEERLFTLWHSWWGRVEVQIPLEVGLWDPLVGKPQQSLGGKGFSGKVLWYHSLFRLSGVETLLWSWTCLGHCWCSEASAPLPVKWSS